MIDESKWQMSQSQSRSCIRWKVWASIAQSEIVALAKSLKHREVAYPKSKSSDQVQHPTKIFYRGFVVIMYLKVLRPQTKQNYKQTIYTITRYGSNGQSEKN